MQIHIFNKIFLISLFSFLTFSEYRVYQYMVSPKDPSRSPSSHVITTSLDPVSYIQYHGGKDALKVDLLKTWMCKGHTGGKETCEDPSAELKKSEDGN